MITIRENVDLKGYTTFAIPAVCRYFVECDEAEEWLSFFSTSTLEPDGLLMLGGGSNLLLTADFPGVVLYPMIKGIQILREDESEVQVKVGCGVVWDDFVAWAVDHGYGGVENLSLIPGHVGATPVQNIGAYGVEVSERIVAVEAIDIRKRVRVVLDAVTCRFAYRDSIFKNEWKNRFLLTHVIYRLDKTPRFVLDYGRVREEIVHLGEPSLHQVRQAIIRIREGKLPDVSASPNAGSFFKNPLVEKTLADRLLEQFREMPVYPVDEEHVKLAAGWLIEAAGWKGKNIGEAAVHDKQALVLVNRGNATGLEVVHLANEIKKSVFLRFGIWLEPEVNII